MGEIITALIGILAIAAVIAGVVQFMKKRQNGCCGGGSGCPHAGCCPSEQQEKKNTDKHE